MRSRLLAAFAALVVALTACASDAADQTVSSPASPTEDDSAAGVLSGVVPTISGDDVDLASYAGQDVILWFWAPW